MDSSNQREILNLAAALDRLGGDAGLLEEVAKLFLDTVPQMLAQIREAVAGRDGAALARAAHTLKGSVGNFGAEAAYQAAHRLEKMGRAGDLGGVEEAYGSLESELKRLQPVLAALSEKQRPDNLGPRCV